VRIAIPAGMVVGILLLAAAGQPVEAQQQAAPVARITLEEARSAVDAAEAEARRNGWNLVFVISDAEGTPIYLRRMDGAPKRNYDVAMNKISTSITAGMNTADYAAAVRAGTIQPIEGALTFEGGLLLRRNGQVVGAFSASGARGSDDAQAVRAGMAAIGIQAAGQVPSNPPPQAPAPQATPAPQPPQPPQAPQAPARVRVPVEVLDRYVGDYEVDSGQVVVTVRREGDTLLGVPTGAPEGVELVPVSHTLFRVGGGASEVEFVTDEAGVVHKILRQNGQEIRARRRPRG
jgi:glc operon protein GlcG